MEWREGEFLVSDDPARLDVGVIHGYLQRSYWAAGIPRSVVERSIAGSLCFGLFHAAAAPAQAGFARVVTDRATFGYLADVFVLEEWRGRGLSKFIVRCVLAHPELQGLRRWMLATADAHGLYRQFGFDATRDPARFMEIVDREIYR
jgi:GNAT superfamily N-acetyltransferase